MGKRRHWRYVDPETLEAREVMLEIVEAVLYERSREANYIDSSYLERALVKAYNII